MSIEHLILRIHSNLEFSGCTDQAPKKNTTVELHRRLKPKTYFYQTFMTDLGLMEIAEGHHADTRCQVRFTPGDGTVPLRSSSLCLKLTMSSVRAPPSHAQSMLRSCPPRPAGHARRPVYHSRCKRLHQLFIGREALGFNGDARAVFVGFVEGLGVGIGAATVIHLIMGSLIR
jgi:hypothetical protein